MTQELDIETVDATEGVTQTIGADFVDENDSPISGSVLDSLTLTYYQEFSGDIINGRNKQNVLQINDVTVDDLGHLAWVLQAGDVVILNDALGFEPHLALFEFSYAGPDGPATGKKVIRIMFANLSKVPTA